MPERRDLYLTSPYFPSNRSKNLIAKDVTEAEVWDIMREFWKEHKIKVHYVRVWEPVKDVRRRYDFGSHTEFFDWMKGDKDE